MLALPLHDISNFYAGDLTVSDNAIGSVGSTTYPEEPPVPLALPNGVIILVKSTPHKDSGDVAAPLGGFDFQRLVEGLQQAMGSIGKKTAPSKTKIELGLEIKGESGKLFAWLVDAGASGQVKLTFEW